jgi:tripartite motif-containing protein 71
MKTKLVKAQGKIFYQSLLFLVCLTYFLCGTAWSDTYEFVLKFGSVPSTPSGVAVDASGNIFVVNSFIYNNRIQKFSSAGSLITQWGSVGHSDGQFYVPEGVAVDASGNVYVADTYNHRIQKFSSNGSFITAWGSFGHIDGQFDTPGGVAVDASGNVYVADTNNDRIQKFDNNGNYITRLESSGLGDGQFWFPGGVAVDASGNIYVADTYNHRIQKFSSNGSFITTWGSSGDSDGQFNAPGGVTVDASGNIYVADTNNHRIQKFSSNGTLITKWGSIGSGDGQFNSPSGITVDASGNVYVADAGNDRIQKFAPVGNTCNYSLNPSSQSFSAAGGMGSVTVTAPGGCAWTATETLDWVTITSGSSSSDNGTVSFLVASYTGTIPRTGAITIAGQTFIINQAPVSGTYQFVFKWGFLGFNNGQLYAPEGVAVDASGNVYVIDKDNHRIQKFSSTGRFMTTWGSSGSGDGQFNSAKYVAVDESGNVYVVDTNNDRIQKFNSNGSFISKWGSNGTGDGQFKYPEGVAVDASGNVYVADTNNDRIQKFSSNGSFITKWGSFGSGDGQLFAPYGVAIDASGNVYVADFGNSRIQKFSSNGSFITKWGSRGIGDGQFKNPANVAVDASGNVYVVDPGNHRIKKFSSNGSFITAWGSSGNSDGQFYAPEGVAVDASGNVYVVDSGNSRIQKFAPVGNTCSYSLNSSSQSFSAAGETGSVLVTAPSGCGWTAASNALWITITSGSGGSGNGTVSFNVAANMGTQRTGIITIGDKAFTIVQAGSNALLYFPHVDTSLPWQTEIAIINTSAQTVTGTLKGFSNDGQLVETMAVTLSARSRRQITVANEFTNHINIGYIIFDTSSATVQGYTKLYQAGIYRAATPAVKVVNTGDIYVSHIDSSAQWWTGVTLVNTTAETKNMTITFNDGQSVPYTLNPNQRRVFTIGSLLNDPLQPTIQSAVITNASGVIGLELFGSNAGIGMGGNQLEGILLTDKTASTIYYPHIDSNGWWTGIVAFNPAESACTITVTPYSTLGTALATSTLSIAGKRKYVGTVEQLNLPAQTAWFWIDSTRPLSGFELFGTASGNQLAAYSESGGTGGMAGVFAKIEKSGWTGIAFVNKEDNTASVTLTAYNDSGTAVATQVLPVGGHAKVVNLVEAIFTQDISGATYIAYTSDRNVVGFQLNGTSDDTMLDALPGM